MLRQAKYLAAALVVAATVSASLAIADEGYVSNCDGECAQGCAPGCARGCCRPASCKPPSCIHCNQRAAYMSQFTNWHGAYYDVAWGTPVALVLPPNVGHQTKWSWGVCNTEVVPISHQFGRGYPGPYAGGVGFLPTPIWPASTDQFGVYYVRGPW